MITTTRKQTPTQARKSALESDFAPLYAVAGVADTFAAQAKTSLIATREKVQSAQGEFESHSKARVEEFTQLVKSLPQQVKAMPETTKAKLAEAQEQLKTLYAEAVTGYGDLAGRGKRAVDEAVGSAKVLSVKAEEQAKDVAADAADKLDPAFEAVQETVTLARKQATGRTATATVTPKATVKAQATKAADEAAATERDAARKAAAKKAAATRAAKKRSAAVKAN